MDISIRLVRTDDIADLATVERDAAARFREVGLDAIADGSVSSAAFIASLIRHGVATCAVGEDDRAVGFLLAGRLDDALHIYELSVAVAYGGKGIGRRLLADLEDRARARALTALTLSTFGDVPWNRPFYERCGFVEVVDEDWTPAFHLLHAAEQLAGLPMDRRIFMRKELA